MSKIVFTKIIILLFASFLFLNNCSPCDGEDPTVVLTNNGTGRADIQIKTTGGNTENLNNIEIGSSSERRSFARGEIEFTISIQGNTEDIVYLLEVKTCTDYDVKINSDNSILVDKDKED
jgi:hypothetical protein